MANIGGLPNLNNRRLSLIQKQVNSTRKSTTIVNDKLKESLDRLEKSVDKRKQSDSFRSWQKTVGLKHSLVEMNALKKCLKKRRESSSLEPELTPRNGVYDGARLDSMKPEIDQMIQEKAPRQRRMRKVAVWQVCRHVNPAAYVPDIGASGVLHVLTCAACI